MPFKTAETISNREIAAGIWEMKIPFSGEIEAGQFFMLKPLDSKVLLPRPISVCDYDGDVITFLYQIVGRGTTELSSLKNGSEIMLTGPLGNGFAVRELAEKYKNIALVSGGIGLAPMVKTGKGLCENGAEAHIICGYRDEPFYTEALNTACKELFIATESGKAGTKGFVTAILNPEDYDAVLACGPEPMMKAVTEMCIKAKTPVYVSLENKMACGIGACLVCTCSDKNGKNHRTCKEGPVFRGEDITFE